MPMPVSKKMELDLHTDIEKNQWLLELKKETSQLLSFEEFASISSINTESLSATFSEPNIL